MKEKVVYEKYVKDNTNKYKRKQTISYKKWIKMLWRCRSGNHTAYVDCEVCNEWKDFQKFSEWFYSKYDPETMNKWDLDKDLLIKGNKIYSPETCCLIPHYINNLFKLTGTKNTVLPGVFKIVASGRYIANYRRIFLGSFKTKEEAFFKYKTEKEKYIKQIAELWKDKIEPRAYEAMINYEVEITDTRIIL
jgi:hypothetical protein